MNALLINENDNVVTVLCDISKDDFIIYLKAGVMHKVKVVQDIPAFHKVSIQKIDEMQEVIKYGYCIGKARTLINVGEHVHCHNLSSI